VPFFLLKYFKIEIFVFSLSLLRNQPDPTMEFLAALNVCVPPSPPPSPPPPSFKPKSRPLCSMFIFQGYEKCKCDGAEPEEREVWKGCKGYRQHGLDICAVHAKSRMRQQRKAASLIQSIVRRNRAKHLVKCLKNSFGQGQHRDVHMLILHEVRKENPLPMPLIRRSQGFRIPSANWSIWSRL
jgi:hypothetical protein